LRHYGLVGSMGRVGAAGDNAAMESFFAVLQKNVLVRGRWDTRARLRTAIVHWVERTYYRKRRQRRLGKLTPVEYELVHQKAVPLAAYTQESTQPSAVPSLHGGHLDEQSLAHLVQVDADETSDAVAMDRSI